MPNFSDEDINNGAFLSAAERANITGRMHAQRRVVVSGTLTENSLLKNQAEFLKLELMSFEPITMILASGGGDVSPADQFIDFISMLHSPVDVIVIEDCCSMAVDLVQACRKRMIVPSARILLHYVRSSKRWIQDDPEWFDADLAYMKQQGIETRDRRFARYEGRTGLSREKLQELFRQGETHSAYFSSEQALGFNLVDEIVRDFKFFLKKSD